MEPRDLALYMIVGSPCHGLIGAFLEIEAEGCSRVLVSNGAACRVKFMPPH